MRLIRNRYDASGANFEREAHPLAAQHQASSFGMRTQLAVSGRLMRNSRPADIGAGAEENDRSFRRCNRKRLDGEARVGPVRNRISAWLPDDRDKTQTTGP